jgi:hypothetical protein
MSQRYRGKVVLVTGATAGMGLPRVQLQEDQDR